LRRGVDLLRQPPVKLRGGPVRFAEALMSGDVGACGLGGSLMRPGGPVVGRRGPQVSVSAGDDGLSGGFCCFQRVLTGQRGPFLLGSGVRHEAPVLKLGYPPLDARCPLCQRLEVEPVHASSVRSACQSSYLAASRVMVREPAAPAVAGMPAAAGDGRLRLSTVLPGAEHPGMMQQNGSGQDGRHPGLWQRASGERERIADQRERRADERERLADQREREADQRDRIADQRERIADEREREADSRERLLEELAGSFARQHRDFQASADQAVDRSWRMIGRSRAMIDRVRAGRQREEAALDRARRERQRARANTDRLRDDVIRKDAATVERASAGDGTDDAAAAR
jgi:hypothetical protein